MNLTLVAPPTEEPVTLAEARGQCRVEVPDDDALLAGYILAAREHVETETRRAAMTQTWDLKLPCWPQYWDDDRHEWRVGIELPRPPLASVASIAYVDSSGAAQTLAADQYQVTTRYGEIRQGLVVPAYGVTWPSLRDQPDAVTVRFVAGYASMTLVPNRIRQAMLLMIGHWYKHRETSIAGTIINEIPMGVDALLDPLRVY